MGVWDVWYYHLLGDKIMDIKKIAASYNDYLIEMRRHFHAASGHDSRHQYKFPAIHNFNVSPTNYSTQHQGIRRTIITDFKKSDYLNPQSLRDSPLLRGVTLLRCSLSNVHRTFS